MKIAIYAQIYESETLDYVVELLDECKNVGAEVYIESDFYAQLSASRQIANYSTFDREVGLDPEAPHSRVCGAPGPSSDP